MAELRIPLPPEMEPYKDDLEYFVATMVRKLHTNRHKSTGHKLHPGEMLSGAEKELEEAVEAWANQGQFELGVECADMSNMAFLAARGAWHMTREEYEESRNGNS